jgi:hypothetical protein
MAKKYWYEGKDGAILERKKSKAVLKAATSKIKQLSLFDAEINRADLLPADKNLGKQGGLYD